MLRQAVRKYSTLDDSLLPLQASEMSGDIVEGFVVGKINVCPHLCECRCLKDSVELLATQLGKIDEVSWESGEEVAERRCNRGGEGGTG